MTSVSGDSELRLEVEEEKKDLEMFSHFPRNFFKSHELRVEGTYRALAVPGPAVSPSTECCSCQAGPWCRTNAYAQLMKKKPVCKS